MEFALVAQLVEHHHGKVGVTGSNPVEGFSSFIDTLAANVYTDVPI
jgi:hypothetical protein